MESTSTGRAVPPDDLAAETLENLVAQFARPMDFLRELVQNALDAGTPRVEVWLGYRPHPEPGEDGWVEVHVRDYGEGMDREIIENQLTRLFSSSKEDDLGRIGKFGIGFVSIFAIRPDAVVVETGREGESWRLRFHPDRSYDLYALSAPVVGTDVVLYKRMAPAEVGDFVRRARWVLDHWCVHARTPVTFAWRGVLWEQPEPVGDGGAPAADDPLAAFLAPPGSGDAPAPAPRQAAPGDLLSLLPPPTPAETITRPLELDDALLSVHRRLPDGMELVVGLSDEPSYGFYNGGLTLLQTRSPEALGRHRELRPYSFKVQDDRLEHTLTRDNVIQDEAWERALQAVRQALPELHEALVEKLGESTRRGQPQPWLDLLLRLCEESRLHRELRGFEQRVLLLDHRGRALPLERYLEQARRLDAVLLDPGPGPLRDTLEARGVLLLREQAGLERLFHLLHRAHTLLGEPEPWPFLRADAYFALPQLEERDTLPESEQRFLSTVDALLSRSKPPLLVEAGNFDQGEELDREEVPALLSRRRPLELLERSEARPEKALGGFLSWLRRPPVHLILNRQHPLYRRALLAAERSREAAALAYLLLLLEELPELPVYRDELAELATRRALGLPLGGGGAP